MRGKRHSRVKQVACLGLIPAYAGKTSGFRERPRDAQAHPRVCGENAYAARYQLSTAGSSPRMRGKPIQSRDRVRRLGLIPAYAGKTMLSRRKRALPSAHPRVCGENPFAVSFLGLEKGSSPRMRGKRQSTRENTVLWGLIPAYAGKTNPAQSTGIVMRAHPRVCGEN